MATTLNRLIDHKAAWHLIDAKGQVVGRLATQIAPILRGKHKPTFCPNDDCGDYVVVINAKSVEFTGKKWTDKIYRYHSGYPGGLKERQADFQRGKKPEEVLRRAVMGMLPKNGLRPRLATKLRIYPGPSHPHEDQLPASSTRCLLVEQERTFADEELSVDEQEDVMFLRWKREAEERERANQTGEEL